MMQRALGLARRGRGAVEPNPMVGCVLAKAGRVVGQGYHRRYGGPHAEVHALQSAGKAARGATCYVTLEPCCHHGKTPPCTDALIAAGVQRIVMAMRDPFPKVAGKGARQLRAAGIEVQSGLLQAQAEELNQPYLKLLRSARPWVILKWAQSIDGKIATRTGDSQWISNQVSRRVVHTLRGQVDGILVGVNTVLADDPALTARGVRPRRKAARWVLDPHLRMPLGAALVRTARVTPTGVVTDRRLVSSPKGKRLAAAGVEVLGIRCNKDGLVLAELLDELGRRRTTNLLVEGGGRTIGSFMDAGLADEGLIFVSPRLIGGEAAPSALRGLGPVTMDAIPGVRVVERRWLRSDLMYRLRFLPRGG